MNSVFALLLFCATPIRGFLSPPSFLKFGGCSDVAVQSGLDLERFGGRWFTLAKMPNEYDPGKFCINTQYTYHGDHMTSTQRGLYEDRTKQKLSTYLVVPDEADPVLTVVASGMPNAPLKIVATDYDSYACLYSCLSLTVFKAEFGIVLSRQPLPPPSVLQTCDDVFSNSTEISVADMEFIEQGKNCPYWAKLDAHQRHISEDYLQSRGLVQPHAPAPIRAQHANAGRSLAADYVVHATSLVISLALMLVLPS